MQIYKSIIIPIIMALTLTSCAIVMPEDEYPLGSLERRLPIRTADKKFIQNINTKEEKDGITLEVLQTLICESVIYVSFTINLGDIDVSEEESIGSYFQIGLTEKYGRWHRGNAIDAEYDAENNTLYYIYAIYLKDYVFKEGDEMYIDLKQIYKTLELPPEAIAENGGLKDGYRAEEILWDSDDPLTVFWTIEKICKKEIFL